MIVKLQWRPKKSAEAPFVVDVPDTLKQICDGEGRKRFPKTGGWGYAVYNYDAATRTSSAPTLRLFRTADNRATSPSRRKTTSSIRTRSVETLLPSKRRTPKQGRIGGEAESGD